MLNMYGKMRIWHAIVLMYLTGFTGISIEFFYGSNFVSIAFYILGITFAAIASYGMWNSNREKQTDSYIA